MRYLILLTFFIYFLSSCTVSKSYVADKKFSKEALQNDFHLMQNILQDKHPSLYWYTPKDSLDFYFNRSYAAIHDSMTELQFGWQIIAPLLAQIRCGHTSLIMSKGWNKYIRNKRIPSFPYYMKIWSDTMVVTGNLNKKDSIIKIGTLITSVNGLSNKQLIGTMFNYLTLDGYETNFNYIRLSTNFPLYHRNIFGLYKGYAITFLDSTGSQKKAIIPLYYPPKDSTSKKKKDSTALIKKIPKVEKLNGVRSFKTDTLHHAGILTINSFSNGHLKAFFRRTFKKLSKENIENLVIDIRANGGGEITNYVALTRYIRNSNFKVSDTSMSVTKTTAPYKKYIRIGFFDRLGLLLLVHKRKDGLYHFPYWENHVYKPKKKDHFTGKTFVLTNGYTFSASSLFCNAVKGQQGVKLIGENTGGGWYGNNGILIPKIVLPETKLRIRLPLFRIVQYQHPTTKGTGVIPDIYVGPTIKAAVGNEDPKMNKAFELMKASQ
ncbi:S41 family peptidase [soil metagenome]